MWLMTAGCMTKRPPLMPEKHHHERKEYTDHRYAFDSDGNWVDAKKTEYKKYLEFTCDCPAKHRMKLSKPSGLPGKRPFADYFAHCTPCKKQKHLGQPEDPNLSENLKISCVQGGESVIHKNAKHALRKLVGSYFFVTSRCRCCNSEVIQDTIDCTVSMEIASNDKRWRYDCLLKKNDKALVAMEVVHTHASGTDKITSVRASGLEIVEFRAEDVMEMETKNVDAPRERTKLQNTKIRTEICNSCSIMAQYREEIHSWCCLEKLLLHEYIQQHEKGNALQRELKTIKGVEEMQKQSANEEKKQIREGEPKQEKSKQMEVISPANLIDGALSNLIYKSLYHPPDGSASWTPYEMIVLKQPAIRIRPKWNIPL
jgi:hypothetical protein